MIVATTANQWRLKEGAKNDRLKKSVATFARRLRCIGRVKRGRRFSDARSAEHVIELRPRHSSVSIKEGSSPKSQIAATFCVPRRARFHYVLIQFHNAERRRAQVSPSSNRASSEAHILSPSAALHSCTAPIPLSLSPATHEKSHLPSSFPGIPLSLPPSICPYYVRRSQPANPPFLPPSLIPFLPSGSLSGSLHCLCNVYVYRRRL